MAYDRKYHARYRAENRERLLSQKREYYARNREAILASRSSETVKEQRAQARARLVAAGKCVNCAEPLDAEWARIAKERRIKNPYCVGCREQQNRNGRAINTRLRQAAVSALGGQCVRCSFSDSRALHIDHVRGGGRQDREGLHPHAFLRKVVAEADSGRYQLLCANCNAIKKHEQREVGGARVWLV